MQLAVGLIIICLIDSLFLLLISHLKVAGEPDGRKSDYVEVAFFQRQCVMPELSHFVLHVFVFIVLDMWNTNQLLIPTTLSSRQGNPLGY